MVAITGGTITYTYDAAGNKLRKQSPTLGNTEYISGMQYGATITGLPDFIQTEEGKAVPSGTTGYKYYYYLGDNLGNTRITFDSSTGTPLQKDDYMPFGMDITRSVSSPKTEYLYNRKELQEEIGQYDYGARLYDPIIGRWMSVDPLTEKMRKSSPYNYVLNNPMRFVDPDGMYPESILQYDASSNTYHLTENAIYFLHLITGVDQYYLRTAIIQSSDNMRSNIPWYSRNEGGGAITLGSHPIGATITFTQNWFDNNSADYKDHGYGISTIDWLDQLSHEVRHIPQIGKAGGYFSYVATAMGQYAAYGGHDNAPTKSKLT